MSLPTRLVADYAELANQYLDNIPVEEPEQFEVIKEALKAITEPAQNHHVPATLADRVTALKSIIEQPELYVQERRNDDEFKNIIIQRVAAKIQEIDTLSGAEKQKYIDDQKALREIALQNQATMASRQPPAVGSEARTVSETEWLQEQQRLFQQHFAEPEMPIPRRVIQVIQREEVGVVGGMFILNPLLPYDNDFIGISQIRHF